MRASSHFILTYKTHLFTDRRVCYERLIQAISRGVEKQRHASNNESQTIHRDGKDAHEATSAAASDGKKSAIVSLAQQFRDLTLNKYSSIEKAWEMFDSLSDQPGQLSRADFKACLKMIGLTMTSKEKGQLRKTMDPSGSKLIRLHDFKAFMMEAAVDAGTVAMPQKAQMANLPVDMPSLPDNYSHRHNVEDQIRDLLIGKAACKGNIVAAQGMVGLVKVALRVQSSRPWLCVKDSQMVLHGWAWSVDTTICASTLIVFFLHTSEPKAKGEATSEEVALSVET